MNENLDMKVIGELRQLALQNVSVYDMLHFLIEKLDLNKDSRILIIIYFRNAFSLEIGEIKSIGAWSFFEGGTWNDEQIENEIKPLINEARWEIKD